MKTSLTQLGYTDRDARAAAVNNSITDGNTDTAPSEDAVHGALESLRGTNVTAYWYETINNGTTGTITPPSGGLVFDKWPDGVDAVASQVGSQGEPNWQTPLTAAGSPVTVALDTGGNYTLSGTPDGYPVAVVYAYRTTFAEFDDALSLAETTLEPSASEVRDDSDVDRGNVRDALSWLKGNLYTDTEAVSAVNAETSLGVDISGNAATATSAGDADTLDGSHLADIQSEIDGDVATHASDPDAHHTRYTDAEAISAAEGAASSTPGTPGILVKWNEYGELPTTTNAGIVGVAGGAGFGAGICPEENLPSGFTPLSGYTDPASDNYGNYQYEDGSIVVFVPKFYYRINHADNSTHGVYAPNDVDVKGIDTFSGEGAANIACTSSAGLFWTINWTRSFHLSAMPKTPSRYAIWANLLYLVIRCCLTDYQSHIKGGLHGPLRNLRP